MDSLTLSDAASASYFSLIDQDHLQPFPIREPPNRSFLNFMALHGEALLRNGYSPIPIQPGKKLPGQYQEGRWSGLRKWSRFLAVPPSPDDIAASTSPRKLVTGRSRV
jgi:hypothetical protein